MPEPVIKDGTGRGISQYLRLDIAIMSLVFGYLLAVFVENHHIIVLNPDNGLDQG